MSFNQFNYFDIEKKTILFDTFCIFSFSRLKEENEEATKCNIFL